ncbi:FAD binding domain-containing protein [Mycena floridula]|nr:FAD binding domain-containing protein [Mycena floridula]
MSAQVLVVGAGPSGLVLALALLQNGISVRLIEKSPDPRLGQRGAGIAPRSLELFHILGLGKEILQNARPMPLVKTYDIHGGLKSLQTFEMSPVSQPTATIPYPNLMLLGQVSLERILREELAKKHHCKVEIDTELISFQQHTDRVDVTIRNHGDIETKSYAWLVGTDGARSTVRKQLPATFLGERPNLNNILVGDIKVEGLDRNFWHMWGDSGSTLISLRPADRTSLFSFIVSGEGIDTNGLMTDMDGIRKVLAQKTAARGLKFGEVTWISTYRPNVRMVNTLGKGRVYLAGDSAHIHSFTGGQDAFNLAWKLTLVEKGLSPPSLLETYAEERLPVIREMLKETTSMLANDFNDFNSKRNPNTSQLTINYRWSSILVDEQDLDDILDDPSCSFGGADLKAGDRAPDAPGLISSKPHSRSTSLFDILSKSRRHTVLLFSDDPAFIGLSRQLRSRELAQVVLIVPSRRNPSFTEADLILEDSAGHASDAYTTGGCKCIIIRPDGIVGALVQRPEGARKYFKRIICN